MTIKKIIKNGNKAIKELEEARKEANRVYRKHIRQLKKQFNSSQTP
jgi:hypothetical protein